MLGHVITLFALLTILFTSNCQATEARVYRVYSFMTDYPFPFFWTRVGSQDVFPALDFQLDSLLVVDSTCGQKVRDDCPRYCRNEAFRDLYCEAGCVQMNSVERSIRCGGFAFAYDASESRSFRNDSTRWTHRFANDRRLQGLYAWDRFRIASPAFEREPALDLASMRFVRGLDLDVRFVRQAAALLGIAPSNNSLVPQAHRQGLIPRPVLSFSVLRLFGEKRSTLFLGGTDDAREDGNCFDWIRRKSASRKQWILEAESLETGGVRTETRRVRLTFDAYVPFIIMPRRFAERLIRANVFVGPIKGLLTHRRATDISLTLRFAPNETLRVDRRFLEEDDEEQEQKTGLRKSFFVPATDEAPYMSEEEVWTLGSLFLYNFCLTLDYERMEISVGHNRVAGT